MKLDIGCGSSLRAGYDGVDIQEGPGVVHQLDVRQGLPFEDNSVEAVSCTHFLEYLDRNELDRFCREVYRVLKPTGLFEFVVTDLQESCQRFFSAGEDIKWMKPFELIYGQQRNPWDHKKMGFTPQTVRGLLEWMEMMDPVVSLVWCQELPSIYGSGLKRSFVKRDHLELSRDDLTQRQSGSQTQTSLTASDPKTG